MIKWLPEPRKITRGYCCWTELKSPSSVTISTSGMRATIQTWSRRNTEVVVGSVADGRVLKSEHCLGVKSRAEDGLSTLTVNTATFQWCSLGKDCHRSDRAI